LSNKQKNQNREEKKKKNVCHILLAFVLFLIFVLKREIGMNVGGGEVDGI
jgi:hypothetical protein